MSDSGASRLEKNEPGGIKAAMGLLAVLLFLWISLPSWAAARIPPAENHDPMLQCTAGGHVVGFQSTGLVVGDSDHALQVAFAGARDVSPRACDVPQESTSRAQPLTRVAYPDLWNGVTLSYTAGEGIFESTYRIAPHPAGHARQVRQIRLRYSVPVSLDDRGDLVLAFKTGQMRESAPKAWQEIQGRREPVAVAFRIINDHEIGFQVATCDPAFPLVIDPLLTWHTFMGSAEHDCGNAIAVDAAGNIFVAGDSRTTWGAPVRPYSGGHDAFVAKLDSSGGLVWNTFLGSAGLDLGYAIAVDAAGNIYVAGESNSTWGAPVNAHGDNGDAFAAKLNSNGGLVWNTFLGSVDNDSGNAIAVDGDGNVCLAGLSQSTWGAPVNAHAGINYDAFAAKLNNNGTLAWHTFLGSLDDDFANAIAVDDDGNICVAGISYASWGAPVRSHAGDKDGFAARLDSHGNLVWNTFLGSAYEDAAHAIAVDDGGDICVAGNSDASWGAPVRSHAGDKDGFAARLDSHGNLVWNTFLGSVDDDFANAMAVDDDGNICVAGRSNAAWGVPARAHAGGCDGFAARLDSHGDLVWNTFWGSAESDFGNAIATDATGNVYVAGGSNAAWGAPLHGFTGNYDVLVARLEASDLLSVAATGSGSGRITSDPAGIDCGAACHEVFASGTLVTLSAAPDPGMGFYGWSGGGCAGTGNCRFTMEGDRYVTAIFYDQDVDWDGDLIDNDADPDDDNDGVIDTEDAFPFDASETVDTDGDGTGDNADTDDDNDGVADDGDAFPLDGSETTDTDGDGTGNNADTDDDNDGAADVRDAFPLDASETTDTDGDGTGDNADADDDNDGVTDAVENAGPNNGDANADAVADSLQHGVASLTAHGSGKYVILEAMDEAVLTRCQAAAGPSPENAPAGVDFPHGFFSFTIAGTITTDTRVKIHLPADAAPDSYYKYGPTRGDGSAHWYEFMFDGYTGAEIDGNVITLHFIDARRGDDILSDDGMIVDIGAPGDSSDGSGAATPAAGGGSGGGGCFIHSAIYP